MHAGKFQIISLTAWDFFQAIRTFALFNCLVIWVMQYLEAYDK